MFKPKNLHLFVLFIALQLFTSLPATADSLEQWTVHLGFYDFVDSDKTLEVGVEYRFPSLAVWKLDLEPMAGLSATSKENIWGYAGLAYDIQLSESWTATPHVALALYEDGDGKDLGGAVEFRSGLEISRQLRNGQRVGLLFYHLSNARLYGLNPGSESLMFTWNLGP
jgi:hypothetical protein